MASEKFSLGIDLGTSNSAMTLADTETGELKILPISQVHGPNSIGERQTMPSSLYYPVDGEFEEGAVAFQTNSKKKKGNGEAEGKIVIGQFAREAGATRPDRLVTSAKSWLCNKHVSPRDKILPWQSSSVSTEDKVSPFEATELYLEHLKESFMSQGKEYGANLKNTHLVLTVPASFEEIARQLTAEAAEAAGFAGVSLMEEPQAAFYSWLKNLGSEWREQVHPGDILLVCDVGGGTTDFSLISVTDKDGNLELERVSVGEHILLGGDNVDLALAYTLRAQLEDEGTEIDDGQFLSLIHNCKFAKEALFSDEEKEEVPVAIPARGSKLVGGSITATLKRDILHQIVFDGFLPITDVADHPQRKSGAGLREFGLAFEQDPVLSKHLARFLTRSRDQVASNAQLSSKMPPGTLVDKFLKPTAVLFNGGFFKARQARERVLELLRHWSPGKDIRELAGSEYDLAVAQGACTYGIHKLTGQGVRIRAGAARNYYIGLESSMLAVPGIKPKVKAVCVVPQGMEEGTEAVLDGQEFGLALGDDVSFRFFSSNIRHGENMGSVVPDAESLLEETASVSTTLDAPEGMTRGEVIPVKLHTRVSEMGTLELWMAHAPSESEWKLEFNVRTV